MSGLSFAEEEWQAQAQGFGEQAEQMNIDTAELSQLQTRPAAADAANCRPSRKRTAAAAFVNPDEGCPPAKRRCGPNGVPVPVATAAADNDDDDDDDGDMDWEGSGFRLGSPVSDGDDDLMMGEGEEDDDDDADSVAMSTFATSEAPSPERYF